MKWLDGWFLKMSKRAWEMSQAEKGKNPVPRELQIQFGVPTMNLLVHRAVDGGYAIEFVKYDINMDRTTRDLYVLADDTKLGEGLAQIITMQALKNS